MSKGDIVTVKNELFIIESPSQKGKLLSAKNLKTGKRINFGLTYSKIKPRTKKGDLYCNRSYFIKNSKKATANDFSRLNWSCRKKVSK